MWEVLVKKKTKDNKGSGNEISAGKLDLPGAFPQDRQMIGAPIRGEAVESGEVDDAVFSEEMLGKGMAILPKEGLVYSPVDGQVTVMMDSMHAVSLLSDDGVELLIHIGLDTVRLGGKYFKGHVKEGDRVSQGQLLLEFDLDALQREGYDMVCPVIICNTEDYREVTPFTGKKVEVGEPVLKLEK
ncbi:MAG: PTS glucose transporter subunit IIA [Lachnospiraceae bacterium]|nr:PTS glucose transporter subunit IIA [Lachnospiraceae bacterium]